jgi:uncharacterized protein with HEPN domain
MAKPRDIDRLHHMLDSAKRAVEYSQNKSLEEIQSNELLSLALIRLLEVFGEAARCTSESLQKRHPEIPWAEIIGTRAWVAHGYMDIDMRIVYNVMMNDLPPLIVLLPGIIDAESRES